MRGGRHKYGDFESNAKVVVNIIDTISDHALESGTALDPDQRLAMTMICVKLGRIVNGHQDQIDSWLDIAGYAKLVADRMARDCE